MPSLSNDQFAATFTPPMRQLSPDAEPPFDFFPYFDAIPAADFGGQVCDGGVTYVWEDDSATFQHVLFNSQDKNVFMVVVLDLSAKQVVGHCLLDLDHLYGSNEA